MPSPGSRRRQQCCFKEGRVRCRRDGSGNPPLCAPHRMVVAEAARTASQPRSPLGAVFEVASDFLSGRPLNKEKIAQAVKDLGFDPFHIDTGEFQHERDNRRRAPKDREYRIPVVDELAERRQAIRSAKVALGFAADEPLTLEQIKRRQRELARRYHPDMPGGSLAKMQDVNTAVDLLEKAL